MKNLYKVKKNVIKEKFTHKVIKIYYSVVRRERYFFNLIGPYVWKEYWDYHCWGDYGWSVRNHHYPDSYDAIMLKNKLNSNLSKVEIETYNESQILE